MSAKSFSERLRSHVDILAQVEQEVKATLPKPTVPQPSEGKSAGKPRKPPRRKPATPHPQRAWQLNMFQHVHELAAQGYSPYDIRKLLHLHKHTVSKYLHMEHTLLITGIVLWAPR